MGLGTDSVLDDVVHGELHALLARFYPTTVIIQAATVTQRPNGEPVETWATAWTLSGNLARRAATEVRDGVLTRAPEGLALNLAGHYEDITTAHRVVVGGEAYNISAVYHDSLGGSTRLELERVEH